MNRRGLAMKPAKTAAVSLHADQASANEDGYLIYTQNVGGSSPSPPTNDFNSLVGL